MGRHLGGRRLPQQTHGRDPQVLRGTHLPASKRALGDAVVFRGASAVTIADSMPCDDL